MNLESQCASLELSRRLFQLGVKQDSLFYWHNIDIYPSLIYGDSTEWSGDRLISAFTCGELGKMLPGIINRGDFKFNLQFYKLQGNADGACYWDGQYYDGNTGIVLHAAFKHFFIADESEVNCRAKMLIHLIESGLMEVTK